MTPRNEQPEYLAWKGIKQRCYDPTSPSYGNYGGRGIEMHWSWINDFQAFVDHVGRRPSSELTLDRIDNDLGYCPGNMRWATRAQQNRNRRNNTIYECDGQRLTQAEWAEELRVSRPTLRRWIDRLGVQDGLTSLILKQRRKGVMWQNVAIAA